MLTRAGVFAQRAGFWRFGATQAFRSLFVVAEKDTRQSRVERDSGQYSGARRVDRVLLPFYSGERMGGEGNFSSCSFAGVERVQVAFIWRQR